MNKEQFILTVSVFLVMISLFGLLTMELGAKEVKPKVVAQWKEGKCTYKIIEAEGSDRRIVTCHCKYSNKGYDYGESCGIGK